MGRGKVETKTGPCARRTDDERGRTATAAPPLSARVRCLFRRGL